MMPGMDGFQVCRRLKEDAATRHIPVVLVTALDGRARTASRAWKAGADEFLTKPIDDVVLFARVRSLTRLKLVIDELREREASGRRMGVIERGRLAPRRLRRPGGDRRRQRAAVRAAWWPSCRWSIGRWWRSTLEKAILAVRGPRGPS